MVKIPGIVSPNNPVLATIEMIINGIQTYIINFIKFA